jgi:hypothetical protein
MKNTLKIFVIFLLMLTNKIAAQESKNDTINQIIQTRINKDKYIGKSFVVLLNDLKIKPVKIMHLSPINNRKAVKSSILYFRNDINNYYIDIVWQDYILKTEINEKDNNGQLNKAEIVTKERKNSLKNKIIKDIITHY